MMQCAESGSAWRDPDFPPTKNSICNKANIWRKQWDQLKFGRVAQICNVSGTAKE